MPTYEYKCEKCGHNFERFQKITEEPVRVCPECEAESVKRLISAGAGIVFKGSGFYVTDYRKEGAKSPTQNSAPAIANDGGTNKTNDVKPNTTAKTVETKSTAV